MAADNIKDDWWEEYFSKGGNYLVADGVKWNVNVDFIEKALDLPKGSRILDLACGYGRISIELASKGYKVVGLDFSNYFLEMGRSEAIRRKVEVEFVQGDMRNIPYRDEFDGVVCWSNSFGFFSDEENEKVLHLIGCSLKRNGKLVLDLHNRDAVVRNRLGKRWFKKDNFFILSDWTFDAELSRSNIQEIIIDESTGSVKKQVMSMREYTLHEMKRMLKDAGLEFLQVYGDTPKGFTPEGFSIDSSLLVLAQKA